ncbi:GumC family protein [Alienimonas californiensis]|uniref:Chain length determinant protein n=1 Tax=Alienimonas californiensis TaxID=2527989 RepID=A0A517P412_9PLAN|nr:hypothetical protein [Alienimonas californiensis]QDT14132.1 hypothetical protein CA12_02000 [Alienimonas californiensis]
MQIPPPDAGTFDPTAPLRLAGTAVRRAWPRMLAFFVAVMGLAFVGLMFAPREYGSQAKLFVRVGRESIGLDPTATTGQTFSLQESRKTEMNSVLNVITTREVYERVAERVGPDVILEQGGWSPADPIFGLLAAATGGDGDEDPEREALTERERAVKALSQSFDVYSAEDSSVIDVTCRADSPELARTLLTEFLGAFQGVYLEMFRSGSFEFFEEQVALLGERHDTAGAALRDAKDAIQATSVEGRRTALQHQLEAIDDRLLLALAERDAKTAERDALRTAIAELLEGTAVGGSGMGVASGSPDDAADSLRKQVDGLRLREQELLSRYTERHPEVLAARERLAAAEALLAGARGPGDAAAASTNPTLQGLHLRALEEQAAGEALDRRIETTQAQKRDLLADLRALNAREAEIDRLQRESDLLAAKYGEYSERLEQARMNRELADGRITNVKVAQPPTLVFKPVSPNKPVVAILAFLLASGGAVALGLLSVLPSFAGAAAGRPTPEPAADADPVTFEPEPAEPAAPAEPAEPRRPIGRPAFAGDGHVDLPR